jgi:hypothetical protein
MVGPEAYRARNGHTQRTDGGALLLALPPHAVIRLDGAAP